MDCLIYHTTQSNPNSLRAGHASKDPAEAPTQREQPECVTSFLIQY